MLTEPIKKGFTLIELLVVISIIGLLATLSVIGVQNARLKAKNAVRSEDMRKVQQALELYANDYGTYPIDDNDGGACGCDYDTTPIGTPDFITDLMPDYMPITPNDPVQDTGTRNLIYKYTSDNGLTYTLQFNTEPDGNGSNCPGNTTSEGGWCTLRP